MSHIRIAVAVLAVSAVAFAGCGSAKSSSQDSTAETTAATSAASSTSPESSANGAALSRAGLIAKADAICTKVRAMLNKNKFKTQDQVARVATRVTAYERAAVIELRKLVPPATLASDWEQIVKGVEILASDAMSIGRYARIHQLETPAGHAVLVASGRHGIREAAIARRDGFVNCAAML
jgi:hypothetical protein